MEAIKGNETLYLVGFRLDPDVFDPQLFTLYVDDERPILWQEQPLLFIRPGLADRALEKCDCGANVLGPVPRELYAVFDFTAAIYTLNEKDVASDSELLDCINVLLDFAKVLPEPMPGNYQFALRQFADHLTFNNDFGDYLEEQPFSRQDLTDAIYWCIGMAVYRMKVIT